VSDFNGVMPMNSQPAWRADDRLGLAPLPAREAASAGSVSIDAPVTSDDVKREAKLDAMVEAFAAAKPGGDVDTGVFDDARLAIKAYAARRDALLDKLGVKQQSHGAPLQNKALFVASIESMQALQGSGGKLQGSGGTGYTSTSDVDFFKELEALIAQDKANLDAYNDIVRGLTEFMADVADIMNQLSKFVHADKDGKNMIVDGDALTKAIQAVLDKYQSKVIAHVPVDPKTGKVDPSVLAQWKKELGGAVNIDADGNVTVNIDKLENMQKSFPRGEQTWDMAKYQAWSTGFSAEKDGIQNDVQTMAEKWSHRNSVFDNFVKILSGSITALADVWKGFLQI
jgi:invasin D